MTHVTYRTQVMLPHYRSILSSIALCLLCVSMFSSGLAQTTEVRRQSIVNGTRQPFVLPLTEAEQLAIGWLASYGTPNTPNCTGTLITSRVVLTAKHCTEGTPPESMVFGLGLVPERETALFDITTKLEHPVVDVTLLYLARDAVDDIESLGFGTSGLESELTPIAYNKQTLEGADKDELLEREVEVVGYGETQDATRSGRWFAGVTLTDIDSQFVTVNGNGIAGVCNGDSGGPVLSINLRGKPVILGVLFGGSATCTGEDYFTRLDPLRDWIDDGIQRSWSDIPEGSRCRDLTFLGRCVNNTVEWCNEQLEVQRLQCPSQAHCIYVNNQEGYYCDNPDFCVPDSPHCDTRYDGFLPAGAVALIMDSTCNSHPARGRPGYGILAILVILAGTRRSRRQSR
ncbi:MAG: S1 family peptidase [Bradymonadia bacterium]